MHMHGTATGQAHACDLADYFMGELDKMVVQQFEEKEIETTGWTLYRDDGWAFALNASDWVISSKSTSEHSMGDKP